jgi:hypothetical protein
MKKDKKLISIFLTISVILVLLFTGPASAIKLSIEDFTKSIVEKTDQTFTVAIDLENPDEFVTDNATMTVVISDGTTDYTCDFDIAGNNLTSCDNFGDITPTFNANRIQNNLSGYGYGYGYDGDGSYLSNGFHNVTGNYSYLGYGYMPGYGYNSAPYGELSYEITWTSEEVSVDTTYTIDFQAKFKTSSNKYFTFKSESKPEFTVTETTGDDGSPSDGGPGITPPPQDPSETKTAKQIVDDILSNVDLTTRLAIKTDLNKIVDKLKEFVEASQNLKVVTDKTEIKENFKKELDAFKRLDDIDEEDVKFVTVVDALDKEEQLKGLTNEIKEEIKDKLTELGLGDKDLEQTSTATKSMKITTVTTNDGRQRSHVEISYKVTVGDHVVEVPKNIAANTDLMTGDFKVVKWDPVVLFENTDNIEFSVLSDVDNVKEIETQSESITVSTATEKVEAIDDEVTEEVIDEETTTDDTTPIVDDSEDTESGSLNGVLLFLVLLIIIAAVVGFFIMKKDSEKPDYIVK